MEVLVIFTFLLQTHTRIKKIPAFDLLPYCPKMFSTNQIAEFFKLQYLNILRPNQFI